MRCLSNGPVSSGRILLSWYTAWQDESYSLLYPWGWLTLVSVIFLGWALLRSQTDMTWSLASSTTTSWFPPSCSNPKSPIISQVLHKMMVRFLWGFEPTWLIPLQKSIYMQVFSFKENEDTQIAVRVILNLNLAVRIPNALWTFLVIIFFYCQLFHTPINSSLTRPWPYILFMPFLFNEWVNRSGHYGEGAILIDK